MPDPVTTIPPVRDPYNHKAGSPVEPKRFGDLQGSWFKVRTGIDVAEVAPDSHLGCVKKQLYQRVRWAVVLDTNTSGCTVNVGRWVSCNVSVGVDVDTFIVEEVHDIIESAIFSQEVAGDPVAVYVTGITKIVPETASNISILASPSGASPL